MLRSALLLLLLVCAGVSAPMASAGRPSPLLALVGDGTTSSVAWLDRVTLEPLTPRRQVYVGLHDLPYAFSPGGSLLALGSGRTSSLVLVDVLRMERVGRLDTHFTVAVGWLSPERLALVESRLEGLSRRLSVAIVDPRAVRVVSRTALPPTHVLLTVATTRGAVVLLLAPEEGIGPPLLTVVTADGVRSVALGGIVAGSSQPDPSPSVPIGRFASPGLALDPQGRRAFVVPGAGPVAQIALDTLTVSYHMPAADRRPADGGASGGEALAEGWHRQAMWLGDGVIAVAGEDAKVVEGPNGRVQTNAPAGLRLLDVSSWSTRLLDEGSAEFTRSGGFVVAWAGPRQIAVWEPDGSLVSRFWLEPGRGLQLAGRYAYVTIGNEYRRHRVRVIDLRSGRLRRTVSVPGWFYPLNRESPFPCWC